MKLAVDGMGGDFAPDAVVQGCVDAVREFGIDIILTGPEYILKDKLKKYDYPKEKIKLLDSNEIITPNEEPLKALKNKKDSSLVKALELVKLKEADAILSAGSTGALMAGASLIVGRIKGIKRVALAPIMPGKNAPFMIIDAGANVDCKAVYLIQFALMGKIYFENILNIKNPSIGLVNIGTEEEKGNELTKKTYNLLKQTNFNFIGNIEPRDIPNGNVNIVVCDGFIGNTILKTYEGVALSIFSMLKDEIMSSLRKKIGGLLLKPVFEDFKKKFDYTEYGGSAFLGANGIVIKAHGSSNSKAFKNAIKQSINFYENDIINKIKYELEKLNINLENEDL
ncbi:phosphate:acyl-[acyl carrier protein] acyltransferase [Clostridium sp. USBA 49]|jgi:glycerol-3-phosphate acyltransferase PlsX|uniref:phosphate acyltransferase PlsX n=1 Tax=Clostridium TaxID=1485 RepID=UPI00099AAC0F|nr:MULTISPECIES: phosphate acyltransferase PlsX [Clostridium]SKA76319.1 phosphate:acyl-[acyl carrier protein] acyltransferase [Clostridium sp. USBA 49]